MYQYEYDEQNQYQGQQYQDSGQQYQGPPGINGQQYPQNSGYNDQGYYIPPQPEQQWGRPQMGRAVPMPPQPTLNGGQPMPQFPPVNFIQDPLIANAALQYGQNLMGHGQDYLEKKIDKYMSVSKMKCYFAVDTQYVLTKMRLIFFPFTHSEWTVQFASVDGVQPRHDVNAPDLYIPLMGLVTFLLTAGLSLGLMNRFNPEVLGLVCSHTLVWLFMEVALVTIILHLNSGSAVRKPLHFLHVMSLSGYKYPGMIVMLLAGIMVPSTGYYFAQIYCSFALILFMFRSLRSQISSNNAGTGNKRRFYLLVFLSLMQPPIMWFLTKSLVYEPIHSL